MKKNSFLWAFAFMLISNITFGQCPFIEEVRLWDNSWNNPSGQSPNNYANYTNDCIPLFATQFTQINITASQGNVYMAMYADLDGNGTFETQIFNFLDANGGTGVNPTSIVQAGTPIRVIVSASPITSGDVIPTCGEAEDYVICGGVVTPCPFIEEVRLWDNSWNNPTGESPNSYEDYTNDCIPLFDTPQPQINITASQGNVYMAMYADLDGNGTFETQIFNFLDANGGTGVNPSSIVQPGTPIRIIVSADPITSGDVIPNCGEVEDYVICNDEPCPFIEEVRLWDNSWNNPTGESPNSYEDYTNDCIPLFDTPQPQINITASQGNVYMAMYADLDGNGTFETQIFNFLDANGGTGVNPSSIVQPGTPIRIIVSADPITSGDVIPNCGEVEDYVICDDEPCPFIERVRLFDNSYDNPSGDSPNNYTDFTANCIPLFDAQFPQINITASQGNVFMAMYADLDGDGLFETQIFNFFDANGGTGVNPTSVVQPGTPIRIIVSADPITSGDVRPNCGEMEEYVICAESAPCDCVNGGAIQTWNGPNCSIGFWLGGFGIDGCATLQPGYTWNFGDGNTSTTSSNWTYHTYANPGIYTVTVSFVVVNNKTGEPCTQTYTLQVKTDGCGIESKVSAKNNIPAEALSISAFPNPSADYVTFSLESVIESFDEINRPELVIIDLMGREIYRSEIEASAQKTVDFREFGNGTYIYQISQNGEILGNGKVMINK